MDKYEIIGDVVPAHNWLFRRIRALRDFADVRAGDLGGWVEHEENLEQTGECWIYDEAHVGLRANVSGNAKVRGNALLLDHAVAKDDAIIEGDARIGESAIISGRAVVKDKAKVYGDAEICADAIIEKQMVVFGGRWEIAPFYNEEMKFPVTLSSPTHITIGCLSMSYDDLKARKARTFAIEQGKLERDERYQYLDLFDRAMEWRTKTLSK